MSVQVRWQGYWWPTSPTESKQNLELPEFSSFDLRTFNPVPDWKGPCCKGKSCPVVVLQPLWLCSLRPRCDFFVPCLFSESLGYFLTAAALSPLKAFHLVDYLNKSISCFPLCVCMSLIPLHQFLGPPHGISTWLLVLRCFWNLSGLGGMAVLVFPFNNEPLIHFLLCYFYFSLASYSLSEVCNSCISSVCGSGTTKSLITRLMDLSWPC